MDIGPGTVVHPSSALHMRIKGTNMMETLPQKLERKYTQNICGTLQSRGFAVEGLYAGYLWSACCLMNLGPAFFETPTKQGRRCGCHPPKKGGGGSRDRDQRCSFGAVTPAARAAIDRDRRSADLGSGVGTGEADRPVGFAGDEREVT